MANINALFHRIHEPVFKPSPDELLALIDFWEAYPQHLNSRRQTVLAAELSPDSIELVPNGSIPNGESIPVENRCKDSGQLSLWGDGLQTLAHRGFCLVVLKIAGERITTPASLMDWEGLRLSINPFDLPEAHTNVEKALVSAVEARGFDSSALVISGRVCRHVSQTIVDDAGLLLRWPSCAGDRLTKLHASDLSAVLLTEKILMRLRVQVQSEPQLPPADQRNKFCYEEWQRGQTLMQIFVALKKHPEWEHVGDEKAIRGPIKSWANKHDPPLPIRPGERGRRRNSSRTG